MSEILKNTLTAELIWFVGAASPATPRFAPGGKYPRAATGQNRWNCWPAV